MGAYEYERDGERFAIGADSGVLYESAADESGARRVLAQISGPMPADVVASTVIELALAGWTPVPVAPEVTEDERRRLYGMTMPASAGETVCQGHADYCAVNGHATWTVDGEDQGTCPRCGEVTKPAPGLDSL
jgi:hypothetical protein